MRPAPAAHTTPIKHYLNGAINSFIYGNGIVHTSHQNTRQLPDLNNDAGVTNDAYTYDENGSLHSITDNQRNLNSRTMGYDDLGRLTTVLAPQSWGTATYDYDGIDNLTKSTITGRFGAHADPQLRREQPPRFDPGHGRAIQRLLQLR